jgi:hypothetical protein
MTAAPDPLGPTVGSLLGSRCEACGGGQRLEVATYQTPVGVLCATVCWPCVAVGNPPPVRSWEQAAWRVGSHCQHLGMDLDQMAVLLQAEHREGSGRSNRTSVQAALAGHRDRG